MPRYVNESTTTDKQAIFESVFTLFTALAQRGSPKECEFYLAQARNMVPSVGSSTMEARTATHAAELESRRLHFEQSIQQLELATNVLEVVSTEWGLLLTCRTELMLLIFSVCVANCTRVRMTLARPTRCLPLRWKDSVVLTGSLQQSKP